MHLRLSGPKCSSIERYKANTFFLISIFQNFADIFVWYSFVWLNDVNYAQSTNFLHVCSFFLSQRVLITTSI